MYDWQNFDVVFQSKLDCSYDEKTVNAILKNRKELAGTLFFDRVWLNLGLKDGKAFDVHQQSIVAKTFFSLVHSDAVG
jgi:hypothetical protein